MAFTAWKLFSIANHKILVDGCVLEILRPEMTALAAELERLAGFDAGKIASLRDFALGLHAKFDNQNKLL